MDIARAQTAFNCNRAYRRARSTPVFSIRFRPASCNDIRYTINDSNIIDFVRQNTNFLHFNKISVFFIFYIFYILPILFTFLISYSLFITYVCASYVKIIQSIHMFLASILNVCIHTCIRMRVDECARVRTSRLLYTYIDKRISSRLF